MKLLNYNSLEEKQKQFKGRYKRIDTWSNFEEFLLKIDSETMIFRGMSEAKYKNYTSAQRYYLSNDLEKSGLKIGQIIQRETNALREDEILNKYYKIMGIEPNWFLLNSYLQHYGGITPLLDFTKNPNVALYFMQEGVNVLPEGGEDIDNYCSLYYLNVQELDNINTTIEKASEKMSNIIYQYHNKIDSIRNDKFKKIKEETLKACEKMKEEARNNIDTFCSDNLFNSYEKLADFWEEMDLVMFLDSKDVTINDDILDYHKRIITTTNFNSIAQDGVFIMRAGKLPFENIFLHCVDIHKSLLPTIRVRLQKNEITKETLFPQESCIAKKALELSLLFDIKK